LFNRIYTLTSTQGLIKTLFLDSKQTTLF